MRLTVTFAVTITLGAVCSSANPVQPRSFDVIVNAANTVVETSRNDLRDVLLGHRREWPNHRRITVVQRDRGSPVVAEVVSSILGMSVSEYNRYLLDLEFRGKAAIPLKAMASDEAICDFVSNAPGAIGFVPAAAINLPLCQSKVRVLELRN